MSLRTTTIGAYPKPEYVPTPDWFRTGMDTDAPTAAYEQFRLRAPADLDALHDRATAEVVAAQVEIGIDVPTDGEIRRENYIHYQCRSLDGIDFSRLSRRTLRTGSWVADLPTITGPIRLRAPILVRDYLVAQAATDHPVKMTLPGPMTILDTVANQHYADAAAASTDLVAALNQEVLALAEAGCIWIQVDEPFFARRPTEALDYGLADLNRCFAGVPDAVTRVVHICCGYPMRLDQENISKADQGAYRRLAPAIRDSDIDAVSIEDGHRRNDLRLLEEFGDKTVILGSFDIASSRVESAHEIASRLREALEHIDADRLMVGPDCGLGLLGENLARRKLTNMVMAAGAVG